MLRSFCIIQNNTVRYFGSGPNASEEYKEEELYQSYRYGPNGPLHSTLVFDLSGKRWAIDDQLYHLAGLIQEKHPDIEWDWFNQFGTVELERRQDAWEKDFIKEFGIVDKHQLHWYTCTDNFETYFRFKNYLENRDQPIAERVKQKLEYWVYSPEHRDRFR